jgi:hypothetical protein
MTEMMSPRKRTSVLEHNNAWSHVVLKLPRYVLALASCQLTRDIVMTPQSGRFRHHALPNMNQLQM